MRVRFWGVRGSIASPVNYHTVERKIRQALELASPADILSPEAIDNFLSSLPFSLRGTYGGNTTCVEVVPDSGVPVIIDAGTGLRGLGMHLLINGVVTGAPGKNTLNFLFTHSHWDHIQGLVFFAPIFNPANTVNFFSCVEDIEQRLRYQQVKTHFPVDFDELPAQKTFTYFPEGGEVVVEGLTVTSKAVRHPGGCYSYRFTEPSGKSFIFCSDAEFNLETMDDIGSYIRYFEGADVLVFDTQYTLSESLQKIDWGHSSAAIATDIALKSKVKKLILFHHDPSYDDERMDAVTLQALKYKDMMAPDQPLEIRTAFEGLELEI